jgi:hypothetical protein
MNDYDPTSPPETVPARAVSSATFRAASCWKFRRRRRCAASPASVFARLVGLGNYGQAATPARGTAIAVEQKKSMDHGRCADVCADRTFRWLRHVLGNGYVPLGNSSRQRLRWRSRIRRRGIQRSVWTDLRGSIRHGRQRVHVELHDVDIGGPEGDRRRDVIYDIPEGHELDLGECDYNRRRRPRTWDDQRNDHHGCAGHRAADWRRRTCDFLGGRGDPFPARCTDHVKAGRSDPGELQSGVGNDRQRNDSE